MKWEKLKQCSTYIMVSLVCQFLCCIFYVLYYVSLGSYLSIHYPYVHVNEVCVVSRRRARSNQRSPRHVSRRRPGVRS